MWLEFRRGALPIYSLNIFNGIWWLYVKSDGLASQSLDEDLHTSSESEHQVESRFLLDIVVRKGSSIFELLSSEDKSLLIGRDTFLILNLGFNILNGVWWFNIKSDGLSSQGLDEDLHTSSESEHQVKSRFLLDVIVR